MRARGSEKEVDVAIASGAGNESMVRHAIRLAEKEFTESVEKERREEITKFIDKLMAEAGIKPIPRFSLASFAKTLKSPFSFSLCKAQWGEKTNTK